MKMMKRTLSGLFWFSVFLGMLVNGSSVAQQPIKVGVIFPLSGGSGPSGQATVRAMESMAAMINEDGGVLGRKIQLVSRDDESTPAVGISRANELISEGISVVIEGWNSPVALAMQPIFNRANIMDITSNAQADQLLSGEGNPLAVKLNSAGSMNGEATAEFIRKRGYKRLALIVQNDVYGTGGQAALEAGLKKSGVSYTVVTEQKFPMSQLDFRSILTSVRDANPDAVVFWNASSATGVPTLMQQYRQARIRAPLIAAAGVVTEGTIEATGQEADGVFSTDFYFSDIPPFDKIPQNARFNQRVKQMHGIKPDKFMAMGALALQIWAKAANETKSLSKDVIAKRIRGNTIKDTILGDLQFAPNGQLLVKFYDFTVVNGKVRIVP
jgi:branched-chain amino acid transport system substrate-binding protein